jgi:hypothetical protein
MKIFVTIFLSLMCAVNGNSHSFYGSVIAHEPAAEEHFSPLLKLSEGNMIEHAEKHPIFRKYHLIYRGNVLMTDNSILQIPDRKTLIIEGDLILKGQAFLSVLGDCQLIVEGDLIMQNHSKGEVDGNIFVKGMIMGEDEASINGNGKVDSHKGLYLTEYSRIFEIGDDHNGRVILQGTPALGNL